MDIQPKLNVHKTFIWCPGHHIYVSRRFDLGQSPLELSEMYEIVYSRYYIIEYILEKLSN